MLSDKAQAMMLLKEAATRRRLDAAMAVITGNTVAETMPDWGRIREQLQALLRGDDTRPLTEPL